MDGNKPRRRKYLSQRRIQAVRRWPQTLCCGSGVAIPGYQVDVDMSTNGGRNPVSAINILMWPSRSERGDSFSGPDHGRPHGGYEL